MTQWYFSCVTVDENVVISLVTPLPVFASGKNFRRNTMYGRSVLVVRSQSGNFLLHLLLYLLQSAQSLKLFEHGRLSLNPKFETPCGSSPRTLVLKYGVFGTVGPEWSWVIWWWNGNSEFPTSDWKRSKMVKTNKQHTKQNLNRDKNVSMDQGHDFCKIWHFMEKKTHLFMKKKISFLTKSTFLLNLRLYLKIRDFSIKASISW